MLEDLTTNNVEVGSKLMSSREVMSSQKHRWDVTSARLQTDFGFRPEKYTDHIQL